MVILMPSVLIVLPKVRVSSKERKAMVRVFSKGKKGKGKGFSKSVQFHDLSCLPHPGIYLAEATQNSRVIIDTGASENAAGMEFLRRLVEGSNIKYGIEIRDRPVFRFGNGRSCKHLHVLICLILHWGRSLSMSSVVMPA